MAATATGPRAVWTIEEWAADEHVHPNTIRGWLREGKVPADAYYRAGGGGTDRLGRARGALRFYVDKIAELRQSWM